MTGTLELPDHSGLAEPELHGMSPIQHLTPCSPPALSKTQVRHFSDPQHAAAHSSGVWSSFSACRPEQPMPSTMCASGPGPMHAGGSAPTGSFEAPVHAALCAPSHGTLPIQQSSAWLPNTQVAHPKDSAHAHWQSSAVLALMRVRFRHWVPLIVCVKAAVDTGHFLADGVLRVETTLSKSRGTAPSAREVAIARATATCWRCGVRRCVITSGPTAQHYYVSAHSRPRLSIGNARERRHREVMPNTL